jgi:hypothetical protein
MILHFVLPVKSKCKSMEINDGFWKLNNCNMPIVTQASHIGIQKSEMPYSVIALICISASIGRVPARMKTAGSATLIYSDRICFNMPIVTQASHIGIQKSENCSAMTTVTENIRKARRALYSLMGNRFITNRI